MKNYTIYFKKDNKYYKQNMNYWEKGGYYVPQTAKIISKDEYDKGIALKDKEESTWIKRN